MDVELRFEESEQSESGGLPVIKTVWDRLDVGLWFSRSGIMKARGLSTWQLAFFFVIGLLRQSGSESEMARKFRDDVIWQRVMGVVQVSQAAMSRFLNRAWNWNAFNQERLRQLQGDPQTSLAAGDVIALDDTHLAHPYAKKMAWVHRLFDHTAKTFVPSLNLVALLGIRSDGLNYPLGFRFWEKAETPESQTSKYDLASDLLLDLRRVVGNIRLWVAMDSWYPAATLLGLIEGLGFDWVARAKSSQRFFRAPSGQGRSSKVQDLIRRHLRDFPVPPETPSTRIISIPGSWWQRRRVKGQPTVFVPVNLVMVYTWLRPDLNGPLQRRVMIIFSNRTDLAGKEIADTYLKRWNIETFFRDAKQTLGFEECHAVSREHITAYVSLLFLAETILRIFDHEIQHQTGRHFGQLTLLRQIILIPARISSTAINEVPTFTLVTRTPLVQRIVKKFWPPSLSIRWWALPASA